MGEMTLEHALVKKKPKHRHKEIENLVIIGSTLVTLAL